MRAAPRRAGGWPQLRSPAAADRRTLQAKQQLLRRNADVLLQHLDLGCCRDCSRVHQREVASLHAMAAWYAEWERITTLRLQALEQGQPFPPLTLPYLELQPFLPEGVPEELPPSIDRCTACQQRLEEVRVRRLVGVREGGGAAGSPAAAAWREGSSTFGRLQTGICGARRPCPAALAGIATPESVAASFPLQYLWHEQHLRVTVDSEP